MNNFREWTLLGFAAEAAGPELWGQYCAALVRYYQLLVDTPFAINDATDALRERWDALRNAPQSLSYDRQVESIEAAIDVRIREQLQSGKFIMTGVVGADERQVPLRLFRHQALRVWLDQNEVELPDGTVFRAVTVSRSELGPGPESRKRTSDKPKKKVTKREVFKDWCDRTYPNEIPPGTPYKQLAREFASAEKVEIDVRTVRRALGKK